MNRLFRLQEPGKSFLDEYLHKTVTLEGLEFSDQMETTGKKRKTNKTNEKILLHFISLLHHPHGGDNILV